MADIRPFQGVHYNPAVVKNLAKVICPPYDVIDAHLQDVLYQRSDYNFVRIEWGKEQPQDKDTFNKYTRAAVTLMSWLEKEILVADAKPSLYLDEHTFKCHSKTLCRRNLYCLVKLEDWSKMVVRPHEGTLAKAKSDRLTMLWTLQANTSPIMTLYEDKDKSIVTVLDTSTKDNPAFSVANLNGENHKVWPLTDSNAINRIANSLANQPLYIADGHHRYESALNYQRERSSTNLQKQMEAPYDFVMMTLVDMADPGLVILPAHRLVRGIPKQALEDLMERLEAFFVINEYPIDKKNTASQVNTLLSFDGGTKFILCGLKTGKLLVLTIRDAKAIRPMFPAFHSEIYQQLDVSIVDHVILEELLGLTHEKTTTCLDYNYDPAESVAKVLNGEYQLGIIVNPVKPESIKAIADSGDRMPHKSTYFYPKAPAGLVSYHFA
ncbi:MAG: DUF1015 domain-containing protein [Dehalococcoidales bacterium]|nr:DUF1015 domain-containing protein [Dehalococcoidales bacterium]